MTRHCVVEHKPQLLIRHLRLNHVEILLAVVTVFIATPLAQYKIYQVMDIPVIIPYRASAVAHVVRENLTEALLCLLKVCLAQVVGCKEPLDTAHSSISLTIRIVPGIRRNSPVWMSSDPQCRVLSDGSPSRAR